MKSLASIAEQARHSDLPEVLARQCAEARPDSDTWKRANRFYARMIPQAQLRFRIALLEAQRARREAMGLT